MSVETVLCGHCRKNQALKPSWGSRIKPICPECYMDLMQKKDPDLHDKIAEHIPGYGHRRKK